MWLATKYDALSPDTFNEAAAFNTVIVLTFVFTVYPFKKLQKIVF